MTRKEYLAKVRQKLEEEDALTWEDSDDEKIDAMVEEEMQRMVRNLTKAKK